MYEMDALLTSYFILLSSQNYVNVNNDLTNKFFLFLKGLSWSQSQHIEHGFVFIK
jgi:hypothetical protein